jgi:hypothetical protein
MSRRTPRLLTAALGVTAFLAPADLAAKGPAVCVELRGTDFKGGANKRFGAERNGKEDVNYVYARPTGEASTMQANFRLARTPDEPMFLHLHALDDDYDSQARVEFKVNDAVVFSGPSEFSGERWISRRYPIPREALRPGEATIAISCIDEKGVVGMPPWFMVALCAIAGDGYELRVPPRDATKDFFVELPEKLRPLPEPLPEGRTEPGFKLRGSKGWIWQPEQYLEEIPVMAKYKLNFLMNCYGSMWYRTESGGYTNTWWEPMPESRKKAYAEIIRSCKEHGIIYCFAYHPQIASPRPLDPTSDADIEQFFQHFAWAQSQGAQWFSVSLDDVSWGEKGPAVGGSQHSHLVNEILGRLREKDPQAQMIFCPVPYWGDGTNPDHRAYLEAVAREMHPDAYIFWTGDGVVTPTITRQAAESYRSIVKHRLVLWDNYPVNDNSPTMHLGPVTGRDADLCEVIDGYMSNPMCTQNQANRIPLLTCADYAYNPWSYDPGRSIGQAIAHLAKNEDERQALKSLVEAYPGMLLHRGGTGYNSVRGEFTRILSAPHARFTAEGYVRHVETLADRFAQVFPDRMQAEQKTLRDDAVWMRSRLDKRYGP